jgi:Asp-tRNA(Asn)/Glu-tRNA(Gln) amidotransferase A subunit family amidase
MTAGSSAGSASAVAANVAAVAITEDTGKAAEIVIYHP